MAFLGYFLFSAISLFKAINITEGIYEVLKIFLSIVYLFVATIILSKNRNYISILVKAVITMATVLSALSIYQYLRYDSIDCCATMANKNQLSSALFLTLPFCLYAALSFHNYWKFIGIIPTVLVLINIFLLQTRAVWVGLFAPTVLTVIVVSVFIRRLDISTKTFLKGFICITLGLIVAISVFGYLYLRTNSMNYLEKRIQSIYSANYLSNQQRFHIWQISGEAIKENLMFGVGAGNWKIVIPSYGLDKLMLKGGVFKTSFFQRPHNDYIWVLSEIGMFGFAFYLSTFGMIIVYIFKILTRHSNTNDKILSILVFFGIIGYMTISFFSFPKERIFHSVFLLLMMAVIIAIYHQSFGYQKNDPRLFMLALVVPCLCLLLFAIFIGYTRLNAEIHTKRAFAAREAKNWPLVISEIDNGYSGFATLDPMSTPLKWYRGEANFLLGNIPQALKDYKQAYKVYPYHIHVLNNLATCYELQGNHGQAIYYYGKALKIFPEFGEAITNLWATYYNSGRDEKANELLLHYDPVLAGHWTMDDNSSSTVVIDSSTHSNDGQAQRYTSILHTTGIIDGALNFNGVSDYINFGDIIILDSRTALSIGCWINPDIHKDCDLVIKNGPILLYMTADGKIKGSVYVGEWSDTVSSANSVPIGKWTHVFMTYDNSNVRLYIDGTLNDTKTQTGTTPNTPDTLTIGYDFTGYFKGAIDDVRIYRKSLSAAEIRALCDNARDINLEKH
ncbi:MAG: LamG-like jellyroll fold domain-containing protein [Planctomycetota bacterium]